VQVSRPLNAKKAHHEGAKKTKEHKGAAELILPKAAMTPEVNRRLCRPEVFARLRVLCVFVVRFFVSFSPFRRLKRDKDAGGTPALRRRELSSRA
jgi:hypothetical protein